MRGPLTVGSLTLLNSNPPPTTLRAAGARRRHRLGGLGVAGHGAGDLEVAGRAGAGRTRGPAGPVAPGRALSATGGRTRSHRRHRQDRQDRSHRRRPAGPAGPVAPSAPAGPAGPVAPSVTGGAGRADRPQSAPVGPAGPIAPSAPAGPAGPTAPSAPAGPAGPIAPSAPAAPAGPDAPVSAGRTGRPDRAIGTRGAGRADGPISAGRPFAPSAPAGPAGPVALRDQRDPVAPVAPAAPCVVTPVAPLIRPRHLLLAGSAEVGQRVAGDADLDDVRLGVDAGVDARPLRWVRGSDRTAEAEHERPAHQQSDRSAKSPGRGGRECGHRCPSVSGPVSEESRDEDEVLSAHGPCRPPPQAMGRIGPRPGVPSRPTPDRGAVLQVRRRPPAPMSPCRPISAAAIIWVRLISTKS